MGDSDTGPDRSPPRWATALDQIATSHRQRLSEIRRHLHRHPEPSGAEQGTTAYLGECLASLGVQGRTGLERRGLIVDSSADDALRRIAFRGDIDALWIQDAKEVPYRSGVPGVMHACGHDAHAACVVGTIQVLIELERERLLPWPVNWRAILQPSEETASGAREMIASGALENVDAIFALHLDPTRPPGVIGVRAGAFTASCDEFEVHLTGRGGHGARPHETIDPIAAAAQAVTALYQGLPRRMNVHRPVVATIGQVAAGHSPNVIPETAVMKGTLRTLDEGSRAEAKEIIADILHGVSRATGCRIEVSFPFGCPGVLNDAALTGLLREAAALVPEGLRVDELPAASMGGEDFAEYLLHVPGTMFRLGCQLPGGCTTLHSPHFDLDERALAIGVRLMARAVILRAGWKGASKGRQQG